MNRNQANRKHQQKRVIQQAQKSDCHAFFNLLTSPALFDQVETLLPAHRERDFPPTETLSMFLAQVMSSDRSCQAIVNDAAIKRLISGLPVCSTHTGGYCKARMRLPLEMVSTLACFTGQMISQVRSRLAGILEDGKNELTPWARALFHALRQELYELDDRVKQADKQVKQLANEHPVCRRLMVIPGIGPMIATALISTIGDANNFKNGRELSSWLGLVPKQYSTGGQQRLLGISKRGDGYVRALLVQGALSAITRCKGRTDSQLLWARQLQAKKGLQKAAVALANKMLRIVWSVMAKNHEYVANV